jgi:serine protease Do
MRSAHRHPYGDLPDRHPPEAVRQRRTAHGPLATGLSHKLTELFLDGLAVGLVFEMRDTLTARRVLAHRPQKQAGGTGPRVGDGGEERRRADRSLRHLYEVVTGLKSRTHRILHMPDTTRDSGSDPESGEAQPTDEMQQPPDPFAESTRPIKADHDRPARPDASKKDPASATRSSRRGAWRYVTIGVISGVLGAALATGAFLWLGDNNPEPSSRTLVTVVGPSNAQIVPAENSAAAAAAQRVLPSIVTVEVSATSVGEFYADSSGSGVVIDESGLLVTNQHVVDGAAAVRVIFADGRTYPAEIVGEDDLTDLAVLSIDATDLVAIELGSTEAMSIGDTAIAVGSPLGLGGGPSVTVGVISAFNRRVQTGIDSELFGMLQTDAPITRGSSGGALVDSQGRLIGITSAIGVSDVGAEGLGFAIPVEIVIRITEDIIDDGQASHAFLGITGMTHFEVAPDGATIPAGVEVADIVAGSAAEAAGLAVDDILLSFDGTPLTTMEQLVVLLRFYRVGDTAELEIQRSGHVSVLTVTLMERPEGV